MYVNVFFCFVLQKKTNKIKQKPNFLFFLGGFCFVKQEAESWKKDEFYQVFLTICVSQTKSQKVFFLSLNQNKTKKKKVKNKQNFLPLRKYPKIIKNNNKKMKKKKEKKFDVKTYWEVFFWRKFFNIVEFYGT